MSIRNFFYLIVLLFIIPTDIFSQLYQRQINNPIFTNGTSEYQNILSGGFNNIEHQFVDIDSDSDFDLFFFNSDGTFGLLKNEGNPSEPEFVLSLDTIPGLKLLDWFYFFDADFDNDFDFFTSNGGYITYNKNTGSAATPFFENSIDTLKDNLGQNIPNETGSNPILADIDGDNDYDFFLGNSAGTITYYENIGTAQNFSFKFITNFWQNILIIGTSANSEFRHGASSLEFADIDSDNDLDLIWGDFFSNSLYLLTNSGTATVPNIQLTSTIYPINEDSVNTSGFNMPRLVDIDSDKDLDLFVSVLYDPSVPQSLMFYENQGNQFNPNLRKITEDYLKTLDVGNNSYPVFVDIDADSDLDIFIGALKNPLGSIYFFRNDGSPISPHYNLLTENFSNITGDLSVVPAFGDVDGDEDYDLFIGKFDGKISYYKNIGTKFIPDFVLEGILTDINLLPIDIGTSSTPFIKDIDIDGDLDLIIGGFNGRITFYKNVGSQTSPAYELQQNYFSGIDVGDNSAPFLIDYDNDGDNDLFSGSRDGNIFYFENAGNDFTPIWTLKNNLITELNFGGNSVPNLIDIDNDSDIDLMFGNIKGGLYLYNNLTISDIKDWDTKPIEFLLLTAYPNPFNPSTIISFDLHESELISLAVYNALGEKVSELFNGFMHSGSHQLSFDAAGFPAGVYFINLRTLKSGVTIKIVLLK
ncbi:MAG: T9SS type A sorting domain-containing protein [Ignavibacteriales bacterium]|nr:T9SS type A sorting domain-containing protein [Ignavibacteriales bacterium]